jgi:tetratricopeptide (TPR) repeat protein
LGDLYREAKVLDMAEKSYRRALQYGPPVSHCFAYSALASIAYENGNLEQCRHWLRKSVSMNQGRHAQGWVAMAQLEESEGNIEGARAVSIAAASLYERGLRGRRMSRQHGTNDALPSLSWDAGAPNEDFASSAPLYRSGDRFLKVYRNWARLEERYGNLDTVEEVYRRATAAFQTEWKLHLDWAEYHSKRRHTNRARDLFAEACGVAANRYVCSFSSFAVPTLLLTFLRLA